MRIIFIYILSILSFQIYSQDTASILYSNEKNFGENTISNTKIRGIEYILSENINEIYLDSLANNLVIQFEDKLFKLNLESNEIGWNRNVSFKDAILIQNDTILIWIINGSNNCLSLQTGENLWALFKKFIYINRKSNIGIAYNININSRNFDELQGINLDNGKVIWSKESSHNFGFNGVHNLNDSTIIVLADGLHKINVNSGKGWYYRAVTARPDTRMSFGKVLLSQAIWWRYGNIDINNYNIVPHIVSNVISEDDFLYFSAETILSKIEKQKGDTLWTHFFPEELTSTSSIFIEDSLIYLINYGYSTFLDQKFKTGKSFFSCYSKESGMEKFFTLMPLKIEEINGYKVIKDAVFIISDHSIFKYSLQNGALIKEISIKKYSKEITKEFIGNNEFIPFNDRIFKSLEQSYMNHLIILTKVGDALIYDLSLNHIATINAANLYVKFEENESLRFISNNYETLIIDQNGLNIAIVNASNKAKLYDNKLYDYINQRLLVIDLTELLFEY